MSEQRNVDVIVVGAGMAGVTAARALAAGGARVIVVESCDRVGGRIQTVRDLGSTPIEAGAELVHGVRAATWSEVRASGLRSQPMPWRSSWLNIGGSTRRLAVHLLHPGAWRSFDVLWSIRHLRGGDRSAASFIDAKGYRGRARQLARLALTAHLPGSVDEVGVKGLVSDGVLHLEGGLNHRILDGYDQLPSYVAAGLDITFGFRAARIRWDPKGVEVVAEDGRTVGARVGVTTLPHGVVAAGSIAFDPTLPSRKTEAIARIVTGPAVKVLLRFEDRFWPRRMAQLICADGPVTLYWPTSFGTDGPPVLIAYATGPRARALSEAGAGVAAEVALDDLDRLFPGAGPRRLVSACRFVDWRSNPNALGGYTFLPPGAVGARSWVAAPDTGALVWAGAATVSSPVADTVEAAYLSGLRAARQASAILTEGSAFESRGALLD